MYIIYISLETSNVGLLFGCQILYADDATGSLPGVRVGVALSAVGPLQPVVMIWTPGVPVPSSLVFTTNTPDIVIVEADEIRMLEVSICINTQSGFESSCVRKESKSNYIALANLDAAGCSSSHLMTLEVGSLGHFTKDAINSLQYTVPAISKAAANRILLELAKIAVLCSFQLFQARQCVS